MDFATWWHTWLTRHPLKAPSTIDASRFTAEVMARVRALRAMPAEPLRWRWSALLGWPRLALATATLAALGVAVTLGTLQWSQARIARAVTQDAQLLAALDEMPELSPDDDAELMDRMVLAEATPSDEDWLEQTIQMLEQVDEDDPSAASNEPSSEEDWLDELELLDETDLAASS